MNYSINSQIAYGWVGDPKKVEIEKEGEDPQQVVHIEDFVRSMGAAEESLGQKILQDNNNQLRILQMISDAGLADLPEDGTATNAQICIELNKQKQLFTNLVVAGKE